MFHAPDAPNDSQSIESHDVRWSLGSGFSPRLASFGFSFASFYIRTPRAVNKRLHVGARQRKRWAHHRRDSATATVGGASVCLGRRRTATGIGRRGKRTAVKSDGKGMPRESMEREGKIQIALVHKKEI